MRNLIITIAFIATGCFVVGDATAQGPGKRGGRKGAVEQSQGPGAKRGRRGSFGQSQERDSNAPAGRPGNRGGAEQTPGQSGQRDMSKFVERMIENFDTDGDKKLDSAELSNLLQAMRERRGGEGGFGGRRGPDNGQAADNSDQKANASSDPEDTSRMRRKKGGGGAGAKAGMGKGGKERSIFGNSNQTGGKKPKRPGRDQ